MMQRMNIRALILLANLSPLVHAQSDGAKPGRDGRIDDLDLGAPEQSQVAKGQTSHQNFLKSDPCCCTRSMERRAGGPRITFRKA